MERVQGRPLQSARSEQILIELIDRYPVLIPCMYGVGEAVRVIAGAFAAGGKLLLCGNGGSAADAEHIAGELLKGFRHKRPLPGPLRDMFTACGDQGLASRLQGALPAIALSGASPLATAIANDLGAELCFAQQVLGYGRPGDAFLGLSTSGNARNVVAAARVSRALGLRTICLTGQDGGVLAPMVEVAIKVPAAETYLVQELHLPVYHAICAAVEEEMFGEQ
ncbi:MAG: SIS domain-containing protein [Bacteroidota bacterium]